MGVENCQIELPEIRDKRGNLSYIEGNRHIPFEIKRIFYLYNIPSGEDRGGHAHRNLHQFIVAVSGQFTLALDDGTSRKEYLMDNPSLGVHISPMIWGDLSNFSSDAVCMVLASDYYDESDYYRNYEEFVDAIKV